MKKILFVFAIMLIFSAVMPVFAQNNQGRNESEFYYVNISLEKIWHYNMRYIVMYRKSANQFARAYIPAEWFTQTDSKGEILNLRRGVAWPSMSVFFRNGEFSHVRLYVHPNASHQTWGTITQHINIDRYFEGIEELSLEF